MLFAADTVYGLACDPEDRFAVERLYLLKRRSLDKPSAVMFFSLERAFAAVPEIGERTRDAMARLLPGAVTVLVPNPAGTVCARLRIRCWDAWVCACPWFLRWKGFAGRCSNRARTAPAAPIRGRSTRSRRCCARRSTW